MPLPCGPSLYVVKDRRTIKIVTDSKPVSTTLFALESYTYSQCSAILQCLHPQKAKLQSLKIKHKRPAMSHTEHGPVLRNTQMDFIFVARAAASHRAASAVAFCDHVIFSRPSWVAVTFALVNHTYTTVHTRLSMQTHSSAPFSTIFPSTIHFVWSCHSAS